MKALPIALLIMNCGISAHAKLVTKTVSYELNGAKLEGFLAYDDSVTETVVTFHGGLIPAPADAGQKTKAKFLILHGALDPLVNKEAVDAFLKSMNDGKFDYQFIAYSGALHAFSNPDADKAHAAGLDGVGYNAEAAARSWKQMQVFFEEVFR